MYGEGCPHKCEYCAGLDDAAEQATLEALRGWGERMRALPKDDPERHLYDMQMKQALDLLKIKPFSWDRPFAGTNKPITFKFWDDLEGSSHDSTPLSSEAT